MSLDAASVSETDFVHGKTENESSVFDIERAPSRSMVRATMTQDTSWPLGLSTFDMLRYDPSASYVDNRLLCHDEAFRSRATFSDLGSFILLQQYHKHQQSLRPSTVAERARSKGLTEASIRLMDHLRSKTKKEEAKEKEKENVKLSGQALVEAVKKAEEQARMLEKELEMEAQEAEAKRAKRKEREKKKAMQRAKRPDMEGVNREVQLEAHVHEKETQNEQSKNVQDTEITTVFSAHGRFKKGELVTSWASDDELETATVQTSEAHVDKQDVSVIADHSEAEQTQEDTVSIITTQPMSSPEFVTPLQTPAQTPCQSVSAKSSPVVLNRSSGVPARPSTSHDIFRPHSAAAALTFTPAQAYTSSKSPASTKTHRSSIRAALDSWRERQTQQLSLQNTINRAAMAVSESILKPRPVHHTLDRFWAIASEV